MRDNDHFLINDIVSESLNEENKRLESDTIPSILSLFYLNQNKI